MSVSVAFKINETDIFVEAIDCRPAREGTAWIIEYMRNPRVAGIVIDGAGGQSILEADMKNAGITVKPILPKVSQVIEANALFEQRFFSGSIKHCAQPALEQAVSNCEHRAIGSSGGFGYSSILEGADISLLEAVTLSAWAAANAKERKKQKVYY